MVQSIIIGVMSSAVASCIFLWALYNFKPKITISKYIAKTPRENGDVYAFKIINKTKSTIFDIKVQALLIQPVQVHGGPVSDVKELNLLKDHFFEMGPFDAKDADAHYALRFGTDEDLSQFWISETQFLRVNVVARHAMSGFTRVETFIFNTKGSIRSGKHEFGTALGVRKV